MIPAAVPSETGLLKMQRIACVVGVIALAAAWAGTGHRPATGAPAYLVAFVFWLNVSLGAGALLMIHDLTGGRWGTVLHPVLDAAARALPLLALLFVPVLLALPVLYPWAREGQEAPAHLRGWMNPAFFAARSAVYFACWLLFSWWRRRPGPPRTAVSGIGLALYVFSLFFASIDWVQSVEPRWSSSIYGLLFVADQGVSALALAIVVHLMLRREGSPELHNDLGNLLLTAVLLWTYLGFSQYLIIWSENLPRETTWVALRTGPGWRPVGALLLLFHFAVPLVLLLFRGVKSKRGWLGAIAAGLLVLRLVDGSWRILPPFSTAGPELHPTLLTAPLGIGGLWAARFLFFLRRGRPAGASA